MSNWRGFLAVFGLVAALALSGTVALAQDPAIPAEPDPGEEDGKRPFGLYLEVGVGSAEADEITTSIDTLATDVSTATLDIDDQTYGRAAIGWKLPEGKGAFRMIFNGYKEDGYSYKAQGSQLRINADLLANADCVEGQGEGIKPCLIPWWDVEIDDGVMRSVRTPPVWEESDLLRDPISNEIILDENGNCTILVQRDDVNCNALPDPTEVRYLPPDRVVLSSVPDNLQNQIQTLDLVYGREFGGRRFSSRWWAGVRYFEYTGQVIATAWLNTDVPGAGFTDGGTLRNLNLAQDTSGGGPIGSWEVDFNFFDKGLVLFVRGQAAFTFNDMDLDSGQFFTVINDTESPFTTFAEARIQNSREKSAWQNSFEAGGRFAFKNGLMFEFAWMRQGFLDVILAPTVITIPEIPEQGPFGTSALLGTQDYVLDSYHAGVSYQF